MINLSLCKKLASAFAKTTGSDYEELLQEACYVWVRYVENSPDYDPSRGSLRAFATCTIRSHFLTYIHREKAKKLPIVNFEDEAEDSEFFVSTRPNPEDALNWKEKLMGVSKEAKFVLKLIFSTPADFLSHNTPRSAITHLRDELISTHKFSKAQAGLAIKEVKALLS